MALVIKRLYEAYFWLMEEVADPRVEEYIFMSSPIPILIIVYLWYKFITQWGPQFMKDREPLELKSIMMVYNIAQVITNGYIIYYVIMARHVINWQCAEVDYSNSYWGKKFLSICHLYLLLKIADLIDTVFFVLRKKQSHVTFLHTYHHFGMVFVAWIGTKFVGGGHSYFLGLANGTVHMLLYSYYLLTSYDSKYGRLLWLKRLITQIQLTQFAFLICVYGQLLFRTTCNYPKAITFFLVPQNIFMIILFGDFYVRSYILEPRRRRLAQQAEAKKDS